MDSKYNYLPTFYFKVVITGMQETLNFNEVSGIGADIETENVREGGVNDCVLKLPKAVSYSNLVLKRAVVSSDSEFIKWVIDATENFIFMPMQVQVTLMKPTSEKKEGDQNTEKSSSSPVKAWVFQNAYPVKLRFSNLSAQKNELLVETVELVYQKMNYVLNIKDNDDNKDK